MMEANELENNRIDVTTAVGRALVGIIPYAGPVLSEALSILIPGQRLDRMKDFVIQLQKRLDGLTEADLKLRVQNCLPLLEEGFIKAARAASAKRRERIAELLAKGIKATTLPEDQLLFLLDLLDRVNNTEIILLGSFAQDDPAAKASYESKYAEVLQERSIQNETGREIADVTGTFLNAYRLHLSSIGLLEPQIATTWNGGQIKEGYNITSLGRLFLDYVGL